MSLEPELPPAPVIPSNMVIPTLPIPSPSQPVETRIDGKYKSVIMPIEIGGRIFKTLNYQPQHLLKKLRSMVGPDGEYPKNSEVEIEEAILKAMVIDPRITDDYLRSDDCNAEEMELLAEVIAEPFKIMDQRHAELKKKVILR